MVLNVGFSDDGYMSSMEMSQPHRKAYYYHVELSSFAIGSGLGGLDEDIVRVFFVWEKTLTEMVS